MKDTRTRRQLNSLDEAASILGISISTLRSHVKGGAVHIVRLGGRIFVHDRELTRIQAEGIPTTIADYKPKMALITPNLEPPMAIEQGCRRPMVTEN
jgi:hypothetical protein